MASRSPPLPPPGLGRPSFSHARPNGGGAPLSTTPSEPNSPPNHGASSLHSAHSNGHHQPSASISRSSNSGGGGPSQPPNSSLYASSSAASASAVPPPPPLSVNSGSPPMQGPSVLQIITMGQERNHAADAIAHHPRIESLVKLSKDSEATWLQIGNTAETLGDLERAVVSYESVLRHNAYSVAALTHIANILRGREDFKKAAEYFGRVVGVTPENGDVWGALGHCFLMIDDLKKAYSSYQQALYYMPNPQEPKLWYGIGILYDRYGSLEHAEEAFSSVIRMDPTFEKANEIFFRLGIIYKQQRKSQQSLECFRYILSNPPRPLTEIDIWFQIGHVYEQQKDFLAAKESYERVLAENPAHAKVLQQLGGLYHRSRAPFYDPEVSVQILTKSLESDTNDPFSWYLLGRAYMTTTNFGKAYESYQQAVYRDGKNPAFWCSIGVLYYNINQYHDALDAYSRAIRIHPYLSEVWFNLGALYESCNDQMSDAIDAYQRTLQLDPSNTVVATRLREIREHQTNGSPLSAPPQPKDISPSSLSWSYAANMAATPGNVELSPALNRSNGAPQSPPGSSHRFEGLPPMGARPQSTDPYRGGDRRASGQSQHSPPADNSPRVPPAHRLSGTQAMLPQMKMQPDLRASAGLDIHRRNSPVSPHTRHSESASEHANYPSQYAGSNTSFHRGSIASDEMEWEREQRDRTARQGSFSSLNGGRTSALSHRRSPPGSSHGREAHAFGQAGPYAAGPPSRPQFDEQQRDPRQGGPSFPPPYHYAGNGSGPPSAPVHEGARRFDPRDRELAEDEQRRRGSGEGRAEGAPIVTEAASGPSASKVTKPRWKKDDGASGKKEGAPAPKSRAKKDAADPATKKERRPPAPKADGAAKRGKGKSAITDHASPSSRTSLSPQPSSHSDASASLPHPPPTEPTLPRQIDEDYDEQSDAMILLNMATSGGSGSGSGSSSPPQHASPRGSEATAPPLAPPSSHDTEGQVASSASSSRKRSLESIDTQTSSSHVSGTAASTKRRKSEVPEELSRPSSSDLAVLPPLPTTSSSTTLLPKQEEVENPSASEHRQKAISSVAASRGEEAVPPVLNVTSPTPTPKVEPKSVEAPPAAMELGEGAEESRGTAEGEREPSTTTGAAEVAAAA